MTVCLVPVIIREGVLGSSGKHDFDGEWLNEQWLAQTKLYDSHYELGLAIGTKHKSSIKARLEAGGLQLKRAQVIPSLEAYLVMT